MRKRLIILSLLVLPVLVEAQFEIPRLSQYLNNGLSINPAYAGSREAMSFTGVYRSIYQGFEGNPKGAMAGFHTPMKNGNVALGFTFENKSYPGYNNNGFYTHYAYRMWLGKFRLSLGLRAGMYNYALDYSELDLLNQTDPSFSNENGWAPNFGTGFYLYNNTFFLGFSVPYLLNLPDGTNTIKFDPASYHYILTSGYLASITDGFKLKTTAMVDYQITGLDIQGGFNYIFMNDKLWLGTLYRTSSKTLTSIFEIQLSKPTRIGIAYDYSFTNLSRVSNGSFEFMFRYELNYESNVDSPVYF